MARTTGERDEVSPQQLKEVTAARLLPLEPTDPHAGDRREAVCVELVDTFSTLQLDSHKAGFLENA
jgi:hypothetical protein